MIQEGIHRIQIPKSIELRPHIFLSSSVRLIPNVTDTVFLNVFTAYR